MQIWAKVFAYEPLLSGLSVFSKVLSAHTSTICPISRDHSTGKVFKATPQRPASRMGILAFFLALLSQCSFIIALSFEPDFNGIIPSILGLTNFSYPTPSSSIEIGFADGVVNSEYYQPWPLVKGWKQSSHMIRFCYVDQASKDALRCSFTDAINLWVDALGGKPSKETGYNIHFVQAWAAGEIQFCYAQGQYNPKTTQGTWNWKLQNRQDILVVGYRPVDEHGNRPATAASLGYTPESVLFPWQTAQARHYIQVSNKDNVVAIAHELGHGEWLTASKTRLLTIFQSSDFCMNTNVLIET